MTVQVFAFARVTNDNARRKVYEEVKNGKSRFGMWDQTRSLREEYHTKNGFLLRIKKGDWIVHVNCPERGKCVAVQVVGEYDFDAGITCSWGRDFCNFLTVDPETIVEFERTDVNVLPSVNLCPMRRGQRVLQVKDFLESLDNLRTHRYSSQSGELRGVVHLRGKMSPLLSDITRHIHEMNKSKQFERFLHEIFDAMPNTQSSPNGFGWGTDHGADLIVEFGIPIVGVNLTTKVVVQAKSYEGDHSELAAVDQIVTGIRRYEADAGLLITTGKRTEKLEDYVKDKSEEIGKAIEVIAGDDVARFVILHAPRMLVGIE